MFADWPLVFDMIFGTEFAIERCMLFASNGQLYSWKRKHVEFGTFSYAIAQTTGGVLNCVTLLVEIYGGFSSTFIHILWNRRNIGQLFKWFDLCGYQISVCAKWSIFSLTIPRCEHDQNLLGLISKWSEKKIEHIMFWRREEKTNARK